MMRCFLLLFALSLPVSVAAQPRLAAEAPLERTLLDLRQRPGERGALSLTDTRRTALARALLSAEPGSALAHEELALRSLLDYEWRRRNAERRGLWDPARPTAAVRAARRARDTARSHLRAALAAEPARAAAHRLAVRLALLDDDTLAVAAAAANALAARPADPEAMLYAGLAAWQNRQTAEASALFARAVERMAPADRAAFGPGLFVRPDDRAAWRADSLAWADAFWRARDPRLLTAENERFVEHAARLVVADLLYAPPGGGRGWATDRGQTLVRYGRPLHEVWARTARDGTVHSWRYADFALTFHDWISAGDFAFASSAAGLDDATRARSLANTLAERASLDPRTLPAEVPLVVSAFRGEGGQTDLVVAYGVRVEPPAASARVATVGLETGVYLRSPAARVMAEVRREVQAVSANTLLAGPVDVLWAGGVALPVAPGATEVRVEVAQAATNAFGVATGAVPVPMREAGLALSSLLVALDAQELGPGESPPADALVRRGVWFRPAPALDLNADLPLRVYAEVYGLAQEQGRSRYEVEARLDPVDEAGRLRQLARRMRGARAAPGVAVAFEASAHQPDDSILLWLDAAEQPDGAYTLTLRVRDLLTGQRVDASRTVRLWRTRSPLPR
jgi:GWxTD domain-containing protein